MIPNRVGAPPGTERYLQPAIARGVVRYVGEPVALVVADDRYVAEDALERIDVVYDPLPACASVAEALAPGAPRLFPGTESNNVAVIPMRVGDADRALDTAAVVVRERFTYPRQTAAALETRGLVAVPPDPRGGELHLIGSTKCIHINRTILAPIFGIPVGALRLTEVDVGGGFGVRGELYPEDVLVPLAAMKLGRPVRWIEERREAMMSTNHAREVEYEAEIGFDADGRIVGLRALMRADIGAYVRTAALVPSEFGAALFPGPYRVPNYHCDLWSVVTNKTPVGTLRSPGRPECNLVRERLMDEGAARLGLDPAEIRRRNLIRADEMPYDSGTTSFGASTVYDSGDYPALFDELLRRLDYGRARADQAAHNARPGPRRGIGLAVYVEKTGLGPFETAHVAARADGRFTVDTGAASMGPGLETVLAQILGGGPGPARRPLRRAPRRHVPGGERRRHLWLARDGDGGERGEHGRGQAHRRGAVAGGGAPGRARGRGQLCGRRAERARSPRHARGAGRRAAAGGGRLVHGAEDHVCGLRGRGHRRRGRRDRRGTPRARGHRGRRRPRGESRPRRRAARGRRRLRHRQHAPRVARVRRRGPAPLRHAHGLRAALCHRHAAGRRLLPGGAPRRPIRSACAGSANAAIPGWAGPSPMRCAMRCAIAAWASRRCP